MYFLQYLGLRLHKLNKKYKKYKSIKIIISNKYTSLFKVRKNIFEFIYCSSVEIYNIIEY